MTDHYLPPVGKHGSRFARYLPAIGFALLFLALLIGLSQLEYLAFEDEGDNLTNGWLMSQGYVLHRDIFSHHFPLANFWTAGVVGLLGPSMPVVRASLLLLQLGVFAAAMCASRFYLQTGLLAVAWSLTGHFHRGHMVLYDNFAAFFLLAAFLIVFSWLMKRSSPSRPTLLFTGFLLGAGVLSDPMMIYASVVIFVGILFAVWASGRADGWQAVLSHVFWVGLAGAAVLGIFAIYLAATGTLDDFYQQVIVFNTQVYDKYIETEPNRLRNLWEQAATALGIGEEHWRVNTRPMMKLHTGEEGWGDPKMYEAWIFTNFFYRLAVITLAVGLVLSGQASSGVFVYLVAAALLVRAPYGFHAAAFIGLGQASAIFILTGVARFERGVGRDLSERKMLALPRAILRAAWYGAALVVAGMLTWSLIRSAQFLAETPANLKNSQNYVQESITWREKIIGLACGDQDVELLYYPMRPMIHFLTGLPPATRYTFMTPWVSDTAAQEVMLALQQNQRAVVYVDQGASVWQYQVNDYLSWLIVFLDENYVLVEENTWISPALAEKCAIVRYNNPSN